MNLFTFKMLLLLSLVSTSLVAQKMSVEDFYSFNRNQRVDAINSMQMFAVNIEKMHFQKMDKKYSYLPLRFLLNQIVSNAVAIEAIDNDRLCIYAGWLSYIPKKAGKKKYCTHPKNFPKDIENSDIPEELKIVIQKEKERYTNFKKEFAPTKCSSPKKIMCNPQLFGHNPGSTKPFCVDGNPNSENSSFQCLKKVETHENKDAVLDIIIDENLKADNAQRLQRLMGMIDDACLCESPNNLIDQDYAKRMYKTQTCFSWVSQVKNISGRVCETQSNPNKDVASIIDLSQNLYRKAQSELLETGISDTEYTKIIESGKWSNANWKARRNVYKDYCKEKENITVLDEVVIYSTKYKIEISKGEIINEKQQILALPMKDGVEITKEDLVDYDIKWFIGDKPLISEKSKDIKKVLVDHQKTSLPIKAKLLKNDKERAVSNEIDLSMKDKYKITISDTTEEIDDKVLLAKVIIDGKEISELPPYKIKWFKGEETEAFDTTEVLTTAKFKKPKENTEVKAVLIIPESTLKVESNKLPFLTIKDSDDDKYEISIEKKDIKDNKQQLLAKVSYDGDELTVEQLKEKDLSIKWVEKLASENKKDDETKKNDKKGKKDDDKKVVDVDGDGIPDEKLEPKADKTDTKNEDNKDEERIVKTEVDEEGNTTFALKKDSFEAETEVFKDKKIVFAKLIRNKEAIKSSNKVDFQKKVIAPYQGPQAPQQMQLIRGPLLNLGGVR